MKKYPLNYDIHNFERICINFLLGHYTLKVLLKLLLEVR